MNIGFTKRGAVVMASLLLSSVPNPCLSLFALPRMCLVVDLNSDWLCCQLCVDWCLWVWLRNSGFLFQCGWVDMRPGVYDGRASGGFFFFSSPFTKKKKPSASCGMLHATVGKLVCSLGSTNPATTTNRWRPSLSRAPISCGRRANGK